MNKRFFVLPLRDGEFSRFGLLCCGVTFLVGSIAGAAAAGFVNEGTKLGDYFSAFLSLFLTGANTRPDFFTAVIDVYKYNLITIALGLSLLGIFFIPALSAIRGFFLSFSISTIVRVVGGKGAALALAIFGANTLITVPCFFVLSVYAFTASSYILRLSVSKNPKPAVSPFNSRFFVHCGICLAVLIVSALIECYVTPRLISFAAAHI
jgi:stage II sporulation protein M